MENYFQNEHDLFNYLLTKPTDYIFTRFLEEIDQTSFMIGKFNFVYHKIHNNKKERKIRLRCPESNNGCRASVILDRVGCIQWMSGFPLTSTNVSIKNNHLTSAHENQNHGQDFFGNKGVPDAELREFICANIPVTPKIVYDHFKDRLPQTEKFKNSFKAKVRRRIDIERGPSAYQDPILDCSPINAEGEQWQFARHYESFMSEDKQLVKIAVLTSISQTNLLTQSQLLVVDGWHKVKIKGFTQLITVCSFLKQIYVPILYDRH